MLYSTNLTLTFQNGVGHETYDSRPPGSIEWFIEDQAFSSLYVVPPPAVNQLSFFLIFPVCRPVKLPDERGGG
jgi:hypothetical protein